MFKQRDIKVSVYFSKCPRPDASLSDYAKTLYTMLFIARTSHLGFVIS